MVFDLSPPQLFRCALITRLITLEDIEKIRSTIDENGDVKYAKYLGEDKTTEDGQKLPKPSKATHSKHVNEVQCVAEVFAR